MFSADILYHRADVEDTHDKLRGIFPKSGAFPLETIGLLANPDHYSPESPQNFKEFVDWKGHFNKWRNYETPEADRWTAEKNCDKPPEIKVLSFEEPDVREGLESVSDLANAYYTLEAILKDESLEIDSETRAEIEAEMTTIQDEYNDHIEGVMKRVQVYFEQSKKKNTVAVTLLRGGLKFEDDYAVDEDHRIRVNVKRLDMQRPAGEDEAGEIDPKTRQRIVREMKTGMTDWTGLEHVQNKLDQPVHLVFADDCISTAVSIRSTMMALYERFQRGEFPAIEKISVYATVGIQAGMTELVAHAQELGIPIEIVVGDVAYRYSDEYYLQRASGEKRRTIPRVIKDNRLVRDTSVDPAQSREFPQGYIWVGDMGFLLKAKQKKAVA